MITLPFLLRCGFLLVCGTAMVVNTTNVVHAAYPEKPLRVLVGFPAGSSMDTAARPIASQLSEQMKQNFVIDNRAGAAGNISADLAAHSRPDGYTLLFGGNAALVINPALYGKLPFDTLRDFAPICKTADAINLLMVNPAVAAASVAQLIETAKASGKGTGKPLLGGSGGVGTPGHLSLELFNMMAGTRITHVPYKGTPAALIDAIAGNIQVLFTAQAPALPHVKAGRVRALAVTSLKRSELMPELPTVSESGLKGFEVTSWYGLLAPAQTPRDIIERLYSEMTKAMQAPAVRQTLAAQGFEIDVRGPAPFAAFIREELAKWAKVVKFSGAKAN